MQGLYFYLKAYLALLPFEEKAKEFADHLNRVKLTNFIEKEQHLAKHMIIYTSIPNNNQTAITSKQH